MRFKNNEAVRQCRLRAKQKEKNMEIELKNLEKINRKLNEKEVHLDKKKN